MSITTNKEEKPEEEIQVSKITGAPQIPGKTDDEREFVTNLYDDIETPFMTLIKDQLMTVYDPEFPLIDIFTLGLVYVINIDEENKHIEFIMTYTTPACPAGDLIQQMMTNAINEKFPTYTMSIEVTFDPMWTLKYIKDQDLMRLFE